MSQLRSWLAAFALLAMALVPTGFMPAFGASGPALVLCPSFGPKPAAPAAHDAGMDHKAMGHGDMDSNPSDSFAKSKNCSLGGIAPAALLPPPAIRAAEKARQVEAFLPRSIDHPKAATRLRPPSRAPPAG